MILDINNFSYNNVNDSISFIAIHDNVYNNSIKWYAKLGHIRQH